MKPSSHDREHPMTTNDRNAGDQSSIGDRKDGSMSRRNILLAGTALAAASAAASAPSIRTAQAQQPQSAPSGRPPNILVIWGDDIGTWNISHNSRGVMGYQTPNIDRIAREGVSFTDYYGQQSCTAGRAAFIGGLARAGRHDQGWSARRQEAGRL
jgi:arylsulfatase